MIIEINEKTLTVNHLHGQHGHIRFLKKEGKEMKARIIKTAQAALNKTTDGGKELFTLSAIGSPLIVKVEIHEKWYYQNGEVSRKDVMNREKFLIDSIFEGLGLDDKYIFEINVKKINSEIEKAIVSIELLQVSQ